MILVITPIMNELFKIEQKNDELYMFAIDDDSVDKLEEIIESMIKLATRKSMIDYIDFVVDKIKIKPSHFNMLLYFALKKVIYKEQYPIIAGYINQPKNKLIIDYSDMYVTIEDDTLDDLNKALTKHKKIPNNKVILLPYDDLYMLLLES